MHGQFDSIRNPHPPNPQKKKKSINSKQYRVYKEDMQSEFEKTREDAHSYPSRGNLKMRGFGLPSCGTGVTEPTSTKPKPKASNPSTASAFLSKPAARPMGLENFLPQTSSPIFDGSGLFSLGTQPRAAAETASL